MHEELSELATNAMDRDADGQPKQKRSKLKSYDQMPAQVLNPNGESGISKTALPKLAKAMAGGNKGVLFFNELCDPLPKRKGIAVSRLSEVQLLNGEKLKDEVYKKNIAAPLYNDAMKEFKDLEPSFKVLMGKGISMEDDDNAETVGRIAYATGSTIAHRDPGEVNTAVKNVYAWLQKPTSKLRALTALLSGGGLFYVAAVHEKCHRAYIQHGYTVNDKATPVSETHYADWARARLCTTKTVQAKSDLDGLA